VWTLSEYVESQKSQKDGHGHGHGDLAKGLEHLLQLDLRAIPSSFFSFLLLLSLDFNLGGGFLSSSSSSSSSSSAAMDGQKKIEELEKKCRDMEQMLKDRELKTLQVNQTPAKLPHLRPRHACTGSFHYETPPG